MAPMLSILDPTFRYTPSVETDIRKTFARIRRELRAQGTEGAKAAVAAPGRSNVLALSGRERYPRALAEWPAANCVASGPPEAVAGHSKGNPT